MLDLDEIIAKAEEAPLQSSDVQVVFNVNLANELDELRDQQRALQDQIDQVEADLAAELEDLARDQRASDPRPGQARKDAEQRTTELRKLLDDVVQQTEQVEKRAADYLVTFRITALHHFEWDQLTSSSMPREGNAEDARADYNTDDLTLIVAKRTGRRVLPDDTTENVTSVQWDGIWKNLPVTSRRAMRQTVWVLHEYAAFASRNEAVIAARKVSTAQPDATQPSPSDSASTQGASPGGNPQLSSTTSTTSKAA